MNDAHSTIVGLKAQMCPGGGFNGMPKDAEPTVGLCLAHGVCGCIYGDAVQHIERMRGALTICAAPFTRQEDDNEALYGEFCHRMQVAFAALEQTEPQYMTKEEIDKAPANIRVCIHNVSMSEHCPQCKADADGPL